MPEKRKRYEMEIDVEGLALNCANCKHGLYLSRRIYCRVLQEKIDNVIPEDCFYFEPEPLEFKLFRRA